MSPKKTATLQSLRPELRKKDYIHSIDLFLSHACKNSHNGHQASLLMALYGSMNLKGSSSNSGYYEK